MRFDGAGLVAKAASDEPITREYGFLTAGPSLLEFEVFRVPQLARFSRTPALRLPPRKSATPPNIKVAIAKLSGANGGGTRQTRQSREWGAQGRR